MAIYKTRWFNRWARKQGLDDLSLCAAVREMAAGLYEADLGSGLVKKRIARSRHSNVATTSKYLHARPNDSSGRYLAV